MNLKIEIQHPYEIQKFLCVLNIGVLECLLNKSMTLEQASAYLYHSYVIELLEKNEADSQVIKLFESCTRLEEIKAAMPEKLQEVLVSKKKECLEILKNLNPTEKPSYWLNRFDE